MNRTGAAAVADSSSGGDSGCIDRGCGSGVVGAIVLIAKVATAVKEVHVICPKFDN